MLRKDGIYLYILCIQASHYLYKYQNVIRDRKCRSNITNFWLKIFFLSMKNCHNFLLLDSKLSKNISWILIPPMVSRLPKNMRGILGGHICEFVDQFKKYKLVVRCKNIWFIHFVSQKQTPPHTHTTKN